MNNTSGLAITSLVLGIIGFIFMWVPILGFVLAVAALIFGIVALSKIKKAPSTNGKVMIIIGLVLSGLTIVYSIIVFIGFMAFFGSLGMGNAVPNNCFGSTGTVCHIENTNGSKINILFTQNLGTNILTDTYGMMNNFGCKALMICATTNPNCNQQVLTMGDGESALITLDCPLKKRPNEINLNIPYTNANSGIQNVATLTISKGVSK